MKSNAAQELHQLIHVLTPHEKRYFKLYANLPGKRRENNYVHLFDVLHSMPDYSGTELEKAVEQAAYARHLPSTLFHLNQLILRSLRAFHAGKSALNRLREQMDFARILIEKGQFAPALKRLRRINKKAEVAEAYLLQLEAMQLESLLLFRLQARHLYAEIEERAAHSQALLQALAQDCTLVALQQQHKALRLRKLDLRNPLDLDRFREVMDHPLLAGQAPATGLRARSAWHDLHGYDALARRDYEQAHQHFSAIVAAWEAQPPRIEETPAEYLGHLTNLLNACIYSKRLHEADRIMQQLRTVKIRTPHDELLLLNLSAYTQLFYCLNRGNYSEGVRVASQIESLLTQHRAQVPVNRQLNYCYNITIFYFLHEAYPEALKWLNRLLQFPTSDIRQNLRDFARIFQLILHYELGNMDLIEYLFRSVYRYYRGKSDREGDNQAGIRLHKFEALIFAAMRQVTYKHTPLKSLAPELYASLWALARNADGKEPAGLYELIFWVQGKVEGIPLKEVYRKRVVARMELVDEKEKGADAATIRALEARETGDLG